MPSNCPSLTVRDRLAPCRHRRPGSEWSNPTRGSRPRSARFARASAAANSAHRAAGRPIVHISTAVLSTKASMCANPLRFWPISVRSRLNQSRQTPPRDMPMVRGSAIPRRLGFPKVPLQSMALARVTRSTSLANSCSRRSRAPAAHPNRSCIEGSALLAPLCSFHSERAKCSNAFNGRTERESSE